MIQLKSALEEMARVQLLGEVRLPTWQRDSDVRQALDGELRESVIAWGAAPGRKALIMGASWPELAVDLARAEMFVTVVDHSHEAIEAVSRAAGDAGLLSRITVHVDDYKARQFEASGFNLIVAWDTLQRYSEQEPLFKKFARELKAGGKLFVRSPISQDGQGKPPAELRRLLRIALSLAPGMASDVVSQDSFLMPGAFSLPFNPLVEELARHLVVSDIQLQHVVAPDLADLAAHVVPAASRLLPAAGRIDASVIGKRPELARFAAIFAAHERDLGKVFTTRSA